MDDVSKLGPLWVSQLRQTVTERRNRCAESLLTINPNGDYAKHHQMLIDAADAMLAAPVAAPAPSEQDKIDAERYRWIRDNADVSFDACVWFTTDSGQRINVSSCARGELDRAVDAGRGAK